MRPVVFGAVMSDVPGFEPFDQVTFAVELLAVLRQIRDQLQTIGDVLSELVPDRPLTTSEEP